jgi:hypothetical protein
MRGMFFRGVVVGSVTAVLVMSASAALAGTGVGGIFNLGQSNTVNAQSSLTGSTGGAELTVSNNSTSGRGMTVNGKGTVASLLAQNTAGPAGAFLVPASQSPFLVNSTHKVTSLNADLLDGLDSTAFKVKCPAGTTLAAGDCVETSARSATFWSSAALSCGIAGRRLASVGDLMAFGHANPGAMTAQEWVDFDYYAVTSQGGSPDFYTSTFSASGSSSSETGGVSESTTHPYRCVTSPSN